MCESWRLSRPQPGPPGGEIRSWGDVAPDMALVPSRRTRVWRLKSHPPADSLSTCVPAGKTQEWISYGATSSCRWTDEIRVNYYNLSSSLFRHRLEGTPGCSTGTKEVAWRWLDLFTS